MENVYLIAVDEKRGNKTKKYVYLKEAIIPTTYILGRTKNKTWSQPR